MYEVIALCICTSCVSCICCFVTGALCIIPKLLQIRKDLDVRDVRRNNKVPRREQDQKNPGKMERINGSHDNGLFDKKVPCRCPKKIIVHTLPIGEEATCGLRKREGCLCSSLRIGENSEWQND